MAESSLPFILFPALGAAIGWLTNWLAVRMLFRPRRPIRVLWFDVQGLLPHRQAEIARSIGRIVERELLGAKDIRDQWDDPAMQRGLHDALEGRVRERLGDVKEKLPPMARGFLSDSMLESFSGQIVDAIWAEVPGAMERILDGMEDRLKVRDLVTRKIEEFDLAKVEEICYEIAAREFRFIELLGGLLGAAVGLAQAGLLVALG